MLMLSMETDRSIVHVKSEDVYEDLVGDVEIRFHTSNYEIKRPLPIDKNKKWVELMKDELGGKIMR